MEGRDAWIGVKCEGLPAGVDWITAVDGRLRWLGTVGEQARRCDGERLRSLLRVGGRESGADASNDADCEREREEKLEEFVEVAGEEEEAEEDEEEKDMDSRRNHFRDVEGLEKLVRRGGISCWIVLSPELMAFPLDPIGFRIKGVIKLLE